MTKTLIASSVASVIVYYFTSIYYNEKVATLQLKIEVERAGRLTETIITERENRDKVRELESVISDQRIELLNKTRKLESKTDEYIKSSRSDNDAISNEWVRIHNESTPLPRINTATERVVETDPRVQNAKEALIVVTENYAYCQMVVDRLRNWQEWYESVSG